MVPGPRGCECVSPWLPGIADGSAPLTDRCPDARVQLSGRGLCVRSPRKPVPLRALLRGTAATARQLPVTVTAPVTSWDSREDRAGPAPPWGSGTSILPPRAGEEVLVAAPREPPRDSDVRTAQDLHMAVHLAAPGPGPCARHVSVTGWRPPRGGEGRARARSNYVKHGEVCQGHVLAETAAALLFAHGEGPAACSPSGPASQSL